MNIILMNTILMKKIKYRMCLVFIFKAFRVILSYSYKKLFIFFYIKVRNNSHQEHKEKLQKESHERYKNLSEGEKDKRWRKTPYRYQNLSEEEEEEKKPQYHRERNKNLPEKQKQKQAEYMKN